MLCIVLSVLQPHFSNLELNITMTKKVALIQPLGKPDKIVKGIYMSHAEDLKKWSVVAIHPKHHNNVSRKKKTYL